MAEEKKRIRRFEDIKVWRKAHELALLVYKLTRSFPREEMFGLTVADATRGGIGTGQYSRRIH